jgi:2-polyprenyl-3-methyl-5-hydroxy-6-metoxy-1,4-benzoquinol methylase
MVYHDTAASETDFDRYYLHNEYYATSDTVGSGGTGIKEQLRYHRIYTTLTRFVSKNNPSIVDIGCGKGGFLSWCKTQGLSELFAIEKSLFCANQIKSSLNISVFSHIAELNSKSQKIDVVVISHVLEHVFHPVGLLKQIVQKTDDNTLFYIEVPNADFYIREPNPWKYLYFEHINHFDQPHIAYLLKNAGLVSIASTLTSFLPEIGSDNECLIVICKKGNNQITQPDFKLSSLAHEKLAVFPDVLSTVKEYLGRGSKIITIWGVSQYVQLMIATDQVMRKHLRFLIDKSPAKYGRYLMGHKVDSMECLAKMGEDDILLIPYGIYYYQMQDMLRRMQFSGKIIAF